jgi:hypothetical protein
LTNPDALPWWRIKIRIGLQARFTLPRAWVVFSQVDWLESGHALPIDWAKAGLRGLYSLSVHPSRTTEASIEVFYDSGNDWMSASRNV